MKVSADGTVRLPLIGPVKVAGLTPDQATDRVVTTYREKEVIQADRDRILVSLLRPRVHRILVVREDSTTSYPQTIQVRE